MVTPAAVQSWSTLVAAKPLRRMSVTAASSSFPRAGDEGERLGMQHHTNQSVWRQWPKLAHGRGGREQQCGLRTLLSVMLAAEERAWTVRLKSGDYPSIPHL